MFTTGTENKSARARSSNGGKHGAPRRRWRTPWLQLVAGLVILAGTVVFLYPQAASWFSQKEQSRITELAQLALNQSPNDNPDYRTEQLGLAHAYNEALASGAVYRANASVAIGEGTSTNETLAYNEILRVANSDLMGRLLYESLEIDLPIYHGTSDETLERGVGHLEGTSLPVGGVGTRSVLTAHRGLPTATLFDNLDKAAIGDTFTITVLDEVLTYRVSETKVIKPDETAEILADPSRDLVTLVTCTPLGINSHRILVTAERITPTPIRDYEAAHAAPVLPGFPWWALILGGVVTVTVAYMWRSGYQPVPTPQDRDQQQ